MSLKAEDIPTWADLSRKFIDQYQYCAEAPPTLLELSTKEMAQGQRFEEYATKWHAQAAKHISPISEVQQIQLFHSTLRGVYYSHLLAHTSLFSDLIEAGKKLDLGIKLGTMEGPTGKGEESSKKVPATTSSSSGRRGKEVSVNAVNPAPGVESPSTGAAEPYFTRFSQYPRARTLTRPLRISLNAASIIKPCRGILSIIVEGPSINMITICTSGKDENAQDNPLPFVIDYTPEEPTVEFAGHMASPALFVVDIPAREPYSDNKVPKETPPNRIEETVGSIFSNTISFSDDELPSEGWTHSRAWHIVRKCNNYIIGRVMIDNGSVLNVCPVTTLKQMNMDLNRIRPSKTAVRAFDGSRREVNGEIDLLIDVGPCSFSITFQVLDIPNAFNLLLRRPWIHSVCAVPSSLHQKLKFIVEEELITVKGEEDYAIYKETAVPYISVGDDENLPFHSFEAISIIRDYGEIEPSRADRMIRKVLLRHNYIPGTGLGARGQGISRHIEIEEYKHRRGLGFRPSCHEIIEAHRGNHLHRLAAHYGRLNRGIPVPPLSRFFPGPSHTIGGALDGPSSDSNDTPAALSVVYAVTEETPSGFTFAWRRKMRSLTTGPQSRATRQLHPNPNPQHFDSNPFEEHLGEPQPVYFGDGLPEDSQVSEIEESLRRLEDHQITSVEPTEEINVGTEEEPRTLNIGTALDPAQRARMIDFLREYQEKRSSNRSTRGSSKSATIPVEKKDGRVRVCVDYRDLNKASPKDNFPLPHIDVLVDNTACHAQFSFMGGFSGYNQIRMAEKDKLKTTFTTMWGTFCNRVMPFGLKNAGATYQRAMLLGFVVSERGIKVDPDKVKAIKELPLPSTVREVRGFLGRLNYIARFIANLTDKCQPLFRLLCKNAVMEWDHELHRQSLGCMLGQENESTRTERAIYYLSKKFTEGESIYPKIEKMCCALVWVMQRLRQYTLYHTIRLLSKADPLRYLLDSPSSMRNIAKWRCQLTEYDIEVGAVLISPDGRHYKVAAKVDFSCTNKVAEYEACILGLQAAIDFKVKELENQFADALATLASMASISEGNIIESLEIEVAKGSTHCNAIESSEAKPWYEDIRNFLQTGQYPPFADRRDQKTLRRLTIHYFLSGEILYRRSFDSTLLRRDRESQRILPADGFMSASRDRSCSRYAENRRGMRHTAQTDDVQRRTNDKRLSSVTAHEAVQTQAPSEPYHTALCTNSKF
ncbi:hypothetical protein CRG98_012016 [Punica granatum]|uniref:G-patch domain-containing protein n=1 Tax=Punica granatum TaxID=22663 RepID=A0A2I0KHB5_PUNGR|nr:hypothetical protein CRG98_012016 [Punica granatum]